jgi:hypothetical protein
MSFFFFILIDFFVSFLLIKYSKKIYNKKDYGFYELSKSYIGYELFGSTIYKVFTDKNGFRSSSNLNFNKKFKIIFLGDSAVYGMMNWEESLPGIFQEISNLDVLNGGIPSYSPTTYLHRYKQALEYGLLEKNHIVIVALDISDVQDEAGHWMSPDYLNLKNVDHPINMSAFEEISENNNKNFNIKNWVISNLKFSTIIYRIIKFNLVRHDYLEPIFNTSRSAFTWKNFDQLNKLKSTQGNNYTRGYLPLGVDGGLKKIEKNLREINRLANDNAGRVYFFTYPWPAQIRYQDSFGWTNYVKSICNEIKCAGTIDMIEEIVDFSKSELNWYKKIFLNGDIHLNQYGNKISAQKIFSTIKLNNNF